jgi:hypothetical protein
MITQRDSSSPIARGIRMAGQICLLAAGLVLTRTPPAAAENWPEALSRMPLGAAVARLNHTNCARLMLDAFQSNAVAKAMIFMPGATDELFFFRRVQATLTNLNPSLYDAVVALTNQSPLRVTLQPPFLLLYSEEDVLELAKTIQHPRTMEKLKAGRPIPRLLAVDRDWNQLLTLIRNPVGVTLWPYRGTRDSWHFYRHTFAGWNLTPWETLEATALAGKTRFTVRRDRVEFEVDPRIGAVPKLANFPGR